SPVENSTKIDLDVVDSEDEETFTYTAEEMRSLAYACAEVEMPAYVYQFNYEDSTDIQPETEKRKDAENAEEDAMDMQPKAKKMRGTSFGKSADEQLEEKETGETSFVNTMEERAEDAVEAEPKVETLNGNAIHPIEQELSFANICGIPPDDLPPAEEYLYGVDIATAMLRFLHYCATSRRSPRYRRRTLNGR
ncbi:hypothetical protein TNCT_316622, partial [Trichonephila clavata]